MLALSYTSRLSGHALPPVFKKEATSTIFLTAKISFRPNPLLTTSLQTRNLSIIDPHEDPKPKNESPNAIAFPSQKELKDLFESYFHRFKFHH
ncbi:MAG: hypothetical protein AAGG81_07520, partial [Chlamydiota bacterium]